MSRNWEVIAARLVDEVLVGLSAARRWVARTRGRTVSTATLQRWIIAGKRGVFLDGVRGPGKSWLTSREAIARFYAALSRASAGDVVESSTESQQQQRARKAVAEFERIRAAK